MRAKYGSGDFDDAEIQRVAKSAKRTIERAGLNSKAKILLRQYSELEAATAFVALFGDRLRYCARAGGWLVWNGRHWACDVDDAVMRHAFEFARSIAEQSSSLQDLDERKRVLSFAIQLERRRGLDSLVALAKYHDPVAIGDPCRLDAAPLLLNVQNGIVDLRTGNLLPHQSSYLITKLSDVPYQPEAKCGRWERFLDEIFAGDPELIDFIQRAIGYSLSGSAREQVFFVLYGLGANGKSTLLNTVSELLGGYARVASTQTFMTRRHEGASNDLARLQGARFVSAIETTGGAMLSEGFIKAVTGGDRVVARFLFREYFEFEPQFKLWLAVNHKPAIRGTDDGIWRRVRLIPFTRRFAEGACDQNLRDKLGSELPGILAWAVRGCIEWQRSGLGQPGAVLKATAGYRAESDVIAQFMSECCVSGPHLSVGSSPLFEAFQKWAERNGERSGTQKAFALQMRERGYADGRESSGRKCWRQIGLASERTSE